jgi:hypothetical protein
MWRWSKAATSRSRDGARHRGRDPKFAKGARKLSLHYQRLGFTPPSTKSEYLYKRIRD